MQIIANGKHDIQRLLSFSLSRGKTYTVSRYLLWQETEDGTLLCNTLTGELVLLSPEEKRFLDSLPGEMNPVFSELASGRYIVAEDCREELTVEQLRALLMKRRETSGAIRYYNILPTTFCNARCFYCYESGMHQTNMSPETAEQLVQLIVSHYDGHMVKLGWFGGEPLIGRGRIDQICGRLEELQISYQSEMTSNGYLFDEALVKHARIKWRLKKIQITLDGTEKIYNRTKAYVGARDNPYQRVLRNIGYFLDNEIRVDIRLNLDVHNSKDLADLIGEIWDRFSSNPYLCVYIRQLHPDIGFHPIAHENTDWTALRDRLKELRETLEQKGWQQFRTDRLPHLRVSSCMADDPAAVQCTPDGILSKCEDQIYEHSIGTLASGITDRKELLWWRERLTHEECSLCPLLPSCGYLLAHCPVKQGKCLPDERESIIAIHLENMLKLYEQWKNAEKKEQQISGELSDQTGREDC